MNFLTRWVRHLWKQPSDSVHAIPDDMADRLASYIRASEQRHTGEIRICVEAALPMSYLWRARGAPGLGGVIRQRAMTWFGRMRIWDTENKNGVLIYLQLAEHAIELVADRGVDQRVQPTEWEGIVNRLGQRLRSGDFEGGLTAALEEVSAVLVQHFPAEPGETRPNELPDAVVRV